MVYFFVVLYLVVVAAVGWRLWDVTRPAGRAKLLDKTARELDLAIDEATAPLVTQRLVARERVGAVGTLVIESIVAPIYAVWAVHALNSHKPPAFTPLFLVIPWAAVVFGQIAARAGLMVYEVARRRRVVGPRVARAQAPGLTDYVRPLELWITRLVVLALAPATTVLLIVTMRGTRDGHFISAPLMVAGVLFALAILTAVELAARRLLALGQPASSMVELAWDDALRSRQLRELYLSAAGVGLLVALYSVIALNLPDWTQPILMYGTPAVIGLTYFYGKPAAHYRRRLWPAPTDRQPYETSVA